MKQVLKAIYEDSSLHNDPLSIASLQRQEEEIKRIIELASISIYKFQEASRELKALVPHLSLEEGEEDDDDSQLPTVASAAAASSTSVPGHLQPATSFAAASTSSAAASRTAFEEEREKVMKKYPFKKFMEELGKQKK